MGPCRILPTASNRTAADQPQPCKPFLCRRPYAFSPVLASHQLHRGKRDGNPLPLDCKLERPADGRQFTINRAGLQFSRLAPGNKCGDLFRVDLMERPVPERRERLQVSNGV